MEAEKAALEATAAEERGDVAGEVLAETAAE